ncbi:hypothetical protein BI375_03220 [Vibrio rotiferianus]|uniref:Uncharacterized protein n=1 Tax=Vibrio rotiferianus TaxID=190895 RepID=A0ABX3DEL4_9VIBR|nr:hypothetical protein [Vibrio rotiferianus]OHY96543.1 hypothetical protein BI375_03220 [Vibrio rotiferianus]
MKFNNMCLTAAIATIIGSTSVMAAPSAKFAATWDEASPKFVSTAVIQDATTDTIALDQNEGFLLTTIKVPQDKELLIGVSAEIGITTDTTIKGKDGGAAKAIAGGAAWVVVTATPIGGGEPIEAAPGAVMLSSRVQELSATLGGVLEECTDGDLDGTIVVQEDCTVSEEQIGLMQETLASHHFNFVLPDMDAGEYELVANFFTRADASVDIDELTVTDGGTVSGSSYAEAFVGKNMVTVQQVRAVRTLSEVEITE